jgi:hypothetical protein
VFFVLVVVVLLIPALEIIVRLVAVALLLTQTIIQLLPVKHLLFLLAMEMQTIQAQQTAI